MASKQIMSYPLNSFLVLRRHLDDPGGIETLGSVSGPRQAAQLALAALAWLALVDHPDERFLVL